MLDVGFSELLIIGIVALIVVGPKELPKLLRTLSKTVGALRRMAGDFQDQFREAMKEADLDDVRKSVEDLKGLNPANMIRETVESATKPLNDAARSLNSDFTRASSMVTGAGASVAAMTVSDADVPLSPPPSPEAANPAPTVGPIELAELAPPQAPDLSMILPVQPDASGTHADSTTPVTAAAHPARPEGPVAS